MGVDSELFTDYYDVPELPDSNSAPEITEPRPSQPQSQSLFSLPNVPINSMPPVRPGYIPVVLVSAHSIAHSLTHLSSSSVHTRI